ncbi:alpha/beta hydrolase [Roseibium sp. CAU 1637]|uniref:Alpha/beta hydrolase n=1 Tax=Roseibium limicola TaxID=2816037 RepID=A0A939EP27_9HYPH|nr:alpha/beta fold hydrolase [Roseibium limicola]MBO0345452.1 alpha/beta hydrolase [Roseibium limicola]
MTDLHWTKPDSKPTATLLLAHGAGAAMDSPFMNKIADKLAAEGIAVVRFEFAYMAQRREGGSKRPPPKADKLVGEYQTALKQLMGITEGPLLIGGKSMGGRVAAMVAGNQTPPGRLKGVVCLGYPFHATGKTEGDWRLGPLEASNRRILILQGERDPFGSQVELDALTLPTAIELHYLEDGNHDFAPRGRSPATMDSNLGAAAKHIAAFAKTVVKPA